MIFLMLVVDIKHKVVEFYKINSIHLQFINYNKDYYKIMNELRSSDRRIVLPTL